MSSLLDRRDLVTAAWRTWGARGIARRVRYEVAKRTGRLRASEARWTSATSAPAEALRRVGVAPPPSLTPPGPGPLGSGAGLRLYGGLPVATPIPPAWHQHPLTGYRHGPGAHWSTYSDSSVEAGDIKDLWELSRLGWLHPMVRHWAATGDHTVAEAIWLVIEDWVANNPPYDGPNWMCGQESSLRAITTMFVADALAASPATTVRRSLLVAGLVQATVGRVAPTLGYALSQRNNHASSEAGFLWSASLLAPWLPGADGLRRRSARALSEVASDQFARDGSYAQHSPTYQRVALHVLLWCLAVARATGEPVPPGVAEAVGRSVPHLRSLMVPGSGGKMPNLGGNDGALVFDLAPTGIGDFRPVLAHAAAATDQPSGLDAGPWEEEAGWFGLVAVSGSPRPQPRSLTTHALTRGVAHAVLRAGPLDHRPAHADQLHIDVWLAGMPVAVDPGSYRYTAPSPWGNGLAGDDVHNLPRLPGVAQAVRSGRFYWRRWDDATVLHAIDEDEAAACLASLELSDGTVLRRLVMVGRSIVVVADRISGASAQVRWNLAGEVALHGSPGQTDLDGGTWRGRLVHTGAVVVPERTDDDPTSGWHAPTYGVRKPVTPVIVHSGVDGSVTSAFAFGAAIERLDSVVGAAASIDLDRLDGAAVAQVVSAAR